MTKDIHTDGFWIRTLFSLTRVNRLSVYICTISTRNCPFWYLCVCGKYTEYNWKL